MTIAADLEDLEAEFEMLGDWEERLKHVMDLGKLLEPLSPEEMSEKNKVRGCASQVWLVTESQEDGTLKFKADSDAAIPRGLIAILLRLFSGRRPNEILAFDARSAFDRLGLPSALSRQRANGLFSMVERIEREAAALAAA